MNPGLNSGMNTEMNLDMDRVDTALDGNAAIGAFAEVFGTDVSTALITCAGCRRGSVFAETQVYLKAPGVTLRCVHCGHVLARVVRTPSAVWVEMRGSVSWRLPEPP